MSLSAQEILREMYRVVEAGNQRNIQIRAIGGLAVRVHDKTNHPLFVRDFADLDFVVSKKQRRDFEQFMPEAGYIPDKQFNILNGDTRQLYFHEKTELKADIFVGDFEMCHKIPLENRLSADALSIPLAELFLSKVQIIELNRKDLLDITSILLNNETGSTDHETINLNVLAQLCSQDWGLYKTTSINLERVMEFASKQDLPLSQAERDLITARARDILHTFEEMPKPIAWQLRDRVGTRVKWYVEVEEIDL
jgi:hypothetical protein